MLSRQQKYHTLIEGIYKKKGVRIKVALLSKHRQRSRRNFLRSSGVVVEVVEVVTLSARRQRDSISTHNHFRLKLHDHNAEQIHRSNWRVPRFYNIDFQNASF